MRPPMAKKTMPAARSIQCLARVKRRRTGVEDMNTTTTAYQIRAAAKTRPIISTMSQMGVAAVTDVAKTEVNKTIGLGVGQGDNKPEAKGTTRADPAQASH